MRVGKKEPLRSAELAQEREDEETYLPPRKAVHPSEQGKWVRIYYLTFLWLFIILVAGLTVWGIYFHQ